MSKWIKNYNELATNDMRQTALDLVGIAYDALDTEKVLVNSVRVEDGVLNIKGHEYQLKNYKKIYVVGFGKVSCQAAFTLEGILSNEVDAGAVVGIKKTLCESIETFEGSHPLPSEVNYNASKKIKEISERATKDDLVLVIVSGGGSAMLCSSKEERDQGVKLYNAFLDSGGDIRELNTVRKHISDMKGGGLAQMIYPAKVVSLIFSDVPGDEYSMVASGPTYKDSTTKEDAQSIINKYDLGTYNLNETPKNDKYFENIDNILLVSNQVALEAIEVEVEKRGMNAEIASTNLYDFPEEITDFLQKNAKQNTVSLAGGEARLIVPDDCEGTGGRCDMLALTMLDKLKDNQVFVAFASDGHDNSKSAGAIVDKTTKDKLERLNINHNEHKVCFDSFTVFEQTGDLIMTGKIEANVSDLMFLISGKNE